MVTFFWFRRDLRLDDNTGLYQALKGPHPVIPLFIFDDCILNELPKDDARVSFIYDKLEQINERLKIFDTSLLCLKGEPIKIWQELIKKYKIKSVFYSKDYEPYARKRDEAIGELLDKNKVTFFGLKDQVLFEENEIVKSDALPYTVFTSYKNKWLKEFSNRTFANNKSESINNYFKSTFIFPSLDEIGFSRSGIQVKKYDLSVVVDYATKRNFPFEDGTSRLGPHLRFGTVSIRKIVLGLSSENAVFLSELIWREFFMQILFHFPYVVTDNFKSKYNGIVWRNNPHEFELWCKGNTGYPLVDAGMRELNASGYMHNRVRMVVAGFLCKHLLIDWRWGEAYFADKLLDYEMSSNNGNWQWAAGTGCDAAPYFRIFNPVEQLKKFDKDLIYVKKWIPEFGTSLYPLPMVDHGFARKRALEVYKKGIR